MNLTKKIKQKRKEKKIAERNKKMKIATSGLATGLLAGVLGGILFAPKSGKETRLDLKNASNQISNNINEKSQKGKAQFNESKKKIKEYLQCKKNKESKIEHLVEDIEKVEA